MGCSSDCGACHIDGGLWPAAACACPGPSPERDGLGRAGFFVKEEEAAAAAEGRASDVDVDASTGSFAHTLPVVLNDREWNCDDGLCSMFVIEMLGWPALYKWSTGWITSERQAWFPALHESHSILLSEEGCKMAEEARARAHAGVE